MASDLHAYWGSGAEQRTLRPPHEASHRAAKRLLVELIIASMLLQELRRGAAGVGLEGGVGPGAAEPLRDVEVTPRASDVQWCLSRPVGGIERGAHAVKPLSEVEVTIQASKVQWGRTEALSGAGVDRRTSIVQLLHDVEVTLHAGFVQLGQHALCNDTVARSSRKPLLLWPLAHDVRGAPAHKYPKFRKFDLLRGEYPRYWCKLGGYSRIEGEPVTPRNEARYSTYIHSSCGSDADPFLTYVHTLSHFSYYRY